VELTEEELKALIQEEETRQSRLEKEKKLADLKERNLQIRIQISVFNHRLDSEIERRSTLKITCVQTESTQNLVFNPVL